MTLALNGAVRSRALLWFVPAAVILAADFLTGPMIHIPILVLIPVFLAAAYSAIRTALVLAIALPLARLFFNAYWQAASWWGPAAVNAGIRIAVLVALVLIIRAALRVRALSREVRLLRGILPICSFCKRIRTEDGRWVRVETYVSQRTDARFSHSLCPDCVHEHYPEVTTSTEPAGLGPLGQSDPEPRGPTATADPSPTIHDERCP